MTKTQEDALKEEIKHIFDSGANEIRVFEMVKTFVANYKSTPVDEIAKNISFPSVDEKTDFAEKLLTLKKENPNVAMLLAMSYWMQAETINRTLKNIDKSPQESQFHERSNTGKISAPKYRKIPIVITKWNDDGVKGWRAEIPDNYETYKPATYNDINFEDLSHHFNHDTETHPDDHLVFSTRKDAVNAARYCNEKYMEGKAKIWHIY